MWERWGEGGERDGERGKERVRGEGGWWGVGALYERDQEQKRGVEGRETDTHKEGRRQEEREKDK